MSKKTSKDKINELLMATGGGVAGGLAIEFVNKQAEKKAYKWYKPIYASAVPLIPAYFLYDDYPALALGMCGAAGGKASKELGIFGIDSDDINGLFDDND